MSPDAISALERGHRRRPQRETVALLASALALEGELRAQFESAARSAREAVSGSPVTVGPWPWSVTPVLPLALTKFFGREADLDEIATLVGKHRFVTLTGAGGVGKTQTALRAATALRDAGKATAYFVDLTPISDSSLVVSAIASALGVQEVPDRPLLETLQAFLRNRALLIVLDNCEHVLDEAASIVVGLLTSCPHVRILATSRERIRAGGERAYRLSSLGVEDASALFADRAQAVEVRFTLTAQNAPLVANICRRLDGIPLAIELAAARVDALSLELLTEQLDHRLALLSDGDRTALPRLQTMRATIDWSYEMLSAAERQVFERLSVFAGGCTFEAARAVCQGGSVKAEDVITFISGLVRKSLVVADLEADEPRYRLLESFREYSREKLKARGEESIVADAHACAYLALAERVVQGRARGDVPPATYDAHPRAELDNWRAAIQWALIERRSALIGQRLVAAIVPDWTYYTQYDARRWFPAALELIDDQTPPDVIAKLNFTAARLAHNAHQWSHQLASAEKAVAFYRETNDLWGLSAALPVVGNALHTLGRNEEARPVLEEAVRIARKIGDHSWFMTWALRNLGGTYAAAGDFVAARDHLTEALRLNTQMRDQKGIELTTMDFAAFAEMEGDDEKAARYLTDLLANGRYLRSEQGWTSGILIQLSGNLIALDRLSEAEERAREALELAREVQVGRAHLALVLERIATTASLQPPNASVPMMERHLRAARIYGFIEAFLSKMSPEDSSVERPRSIDCGMSRLRDTLGAYALATSMAEGSSMTEDDAVELATTLSYSRADSMARLAVSRANARS